MICNSSSTWKTSKDLPNHSSCKKNHMQLLYFLEKARICSKSHLSLQKSLLILWVGCKNIFMCTLLGVVSVLLNMAFLSEEACLAGGLDSMTSRSPFQPLPFCDSVKLECFFFMSQCSQNLILILPKFSFICT